MSDWVSLPAHFSSFSWVSLSLNISVFHTVTFWGCFYKPCLTPKAHHRFLLFFSGPNLSPPLIQRKLAQWTVATVPPSGGKAQLQRLRRPGQRLRAGEEKCNPHLIKLLINTLVLRAQWRKGDITACNLCLVILKPNTKTKSGVKPFLLSCFEQVSLLLFPLSFLCDISYTG